MIAVYLRLRARVKTVNQLNRLHINLENRMTPLELVELRALSSEGGRRGFGLNRLMRALHRRLPRRLRKALMGHRDNIEMTLRGGPVSDETIGRESERWLVRLRQAPGFEQIVRPQPFHREGIRCDIVRYTSGGDRARKTLTLCFAGAAQRMKMPTPIFLNHFDPARTDVVLLRDPLRSGYRKGLKGVADDVMGMVDALPAIVHAGDYRRVVVIGGSGGGQPGLIAALSLPAEIMLWVGGNEPDDPRWRDLAEVGAPDVLRRLRAGPGRNLKLFLVYGEDAARDKRAAEGMVELLGGEIVTVTDPEKSVGHNPLWPLVLQKRLKDFLDERLYV